MTWAILHRAVLLQLHAVVGLILLIGAVAVFVRAMRRSTRAVKVATGVGMVAVLGAGLNGGSFLNYNEDFSSMIMASFFAIALAAYAACLYFDTQRA